MKNLKYSIILLSVLIYTAGCKKHDDNNNPNNDNNNNNNNNQKILTSMNIGDAKTLFILNPSAQMKLLEGASVNKLYKVTEEGLVVEVTLTDDDGNSLTNVVSPKFICNLSDDYFTVTFMGDQYTSSQINGTFLVRKSDGAVFKGDNLPMQAPGVLPGTYENIRCRRDLFLQYDKFGNIYYYNNQKIMKLTITDPDNPTISLYSAYGDQAGDYCIDKEGNMLYSGENGSGPHKYRSVVDGFRFIEACSSLWTDFSDTIYFKTNFSQYPYIYKIIPSPFEVKVYGDTLFQSEYIAQLVKIKNKNTIISATHSWQGQGNIQELYNNERVLKKTPFSYYGIYNLKKMIASDNYYYIASTDESYNSKLLKIDPTDNTYVNLLTTGQYDIFDIVVSSTDEIQFYAIRLLDGNPVLCKIGSGGTVEEISQLNGGTISVLERIN